MCSFFFVAESLVNNQINRVVSHPTLPVTITAHEDRHIRFFDNNTGKATEWYVQPFYDIYTEH